MKQLFLGLLLLLLCPALSLAADTQLTGMWQGEYQHSSGQDPVKFDMALIQDGATVVGFIKEKNTFGKRTEQPWLHAIVKGRFDKKTDKLTLTKTYDGTAGEEHDVEYSGKLSERGKKLEGKWTVKEDQNGPFTAEKVAETGSGSSAGIWSGTYQYPDGSGQGPVKFQVIIIQQGQELTGFIKEPNTFGENKDEPWLHADIKGNFDKDAGKLTFTKTYDGTAGPSHDVEYSGTLSEDGKKVEGNWTLGNLSGAFTIEKLSLDKQTLDSIKEGPARE